MIYTQKQAANMHKILQNLHTQFRHAKLGARYGMFESLGPIKIILSEDEAKAIRQWASLKEN